MAGVAGRAGCEGVELARDDAQPGIRRQLLAQRGQRRAVTQQAGRIAAAEQIGREMDATHRSSGADHPMRPSSKYSISAFCKCVLFWLRPGADAPSHRCAM
jgi:hypothetical protein